MNYILDWGSQKRKGASRLVEWNDCSVTLGQLSGIQQLRIETSGPWTWISGGQFPHKANFCPCTENILVCVCHTINWSVIITSVIVMLWSMVGLIPSSSIDDKYRSHDKNLWRSYRSLFFPVTSLWSCAVNGMTEVVRRWQWRRSYRGTAAILEKKRSPFPFESRSGRRTWRWNR